MTPFRSLALLGCLLGCASLAATEFPWKGHGTLSLDVPEGWKIESQAVEDLGYRFFATSTRTAAALLQVTIVRLPPGKELRPDDIPARLEESLGKYVPESVEKELRPVRLKSRQGVGFYAELTDSKLVGKPPVPDDYKVLRSALVALDESTLLIATMQFDDPDGDEAGEMLALVSSVRFSRAGHRGETTWRLPGTGRRLFCNAPAAGPC